jgi:hypothetical protein
VATAFPTATVALGTTIRRRRPWLWARRLRGQHAWVLLPGCDLRHSYLGRCHHI